VDVICAFVSLNVPSDSRCRQPVSEIERDESDDCMLDPEVVAPD
jgi:hypothetical protein